MEWLSKDLDRGQAALYCIAFLITATLIWFGRKRLLIAIPCAWMFFFLAAIAIPSFLPARPTAHRNACVNNLREIRAAKTEWAIVNHKLPTDVPTEEDLYGINGTNSFLRRKLICPAGGNYTFGAGNEDPQCSLADKGHNYP